MSGAPLVAISELGYWTPETTLQQAGVVGRFKEPDSLGTAEFQQWQALDVSYRLREHHIAGAISDEAVSEAEEICDLGLERATTIAEQAEPWTKRQVNSFNVTVLGTLSRWLSSDRFESFDRTVEETLVQVEEAVLAQTKKLYEVAQEITITPDKARYMNSFGPLFELATAGMVLASTHFRHNGFVPQVAKPAYEIRREGNPSPMDVLLVKYDDFSESSHIAAGIQCKGMSWLHKKDFDHTDPYVHLLRSTHLVGNRMVSPSKSAVESWLSEDGRDAVQRRFIGSVALNEKSVLRDMLGVRAYKNRNSWRIYFSDDNGTSHRPLPRY